MSLDARFRASGRPSRRGSSRLARPPREWPARSAAATAGYSGNDDAVGMRRLAAGGPCGGRLRRRAALPSGTSESRKAPETPNATSVVSSASVLRDSAEFGADEARDVEAERVEPHPRHRGIMHARDRETERQRAERTAAARVGAAVQRPEREARWPPIDTAPRRRRTAVPDESAPPDAPPTCRHSASG